MSLFVARYNEVDVLAFWQGLEMPDVVELSVPNLVQKTIGRLAIHRNLKQHAGSDKVLRSESLYSLNETK